MNSYWPFLLTLLFLYSCQCQKKTESPQPPNLVAESSPSTSLADDLSGYEAALKAYNQRKATDTDQSIEKNLIQMAGNRVSRVGKELKFKILNNTLSILNDGDDETEDKYVFTFYFKKLHLYLVSVGKWEGSGSIIISETMGKIYHIDANPIFSPSMNRFATISWDMQAGYNPNRVQVWKVENGEIILDWDSTELDDWGPDGATWVSDDKLVLDMRGLDKNFNEYKMDTQYELSLTGKGWSGQIIKKK